jgi:hypothetical protein
MESRACPTCHFIIPGGSPVIDSEILGGSQPLRDDDLARVGEHCNPLLEVVGSNEELSASANRRDGEAIGSSRLLGDSHSATADASVPVAGESVSAGKNGPRLLVDIRPMIVRNTTNSISNIERLCDDFYDGIVEVCEAEGVQALVLKSGPYSPSTWVKFECWQSHPSSNSLTNRSSVVFSFRPRPFHRYEYELDIEANDGVKRRKYSSVAGFTRSDALAIVRYLLNRSRSRTPPFRLTFLRQYLLQFGGLETRSRD